MGQLAQSLAAMMMLVALSVSCGDSRPVVVQNPMTPSPVAPPTAPAPTPFPGPGTYAFVDSPVTGRTVFPFTSRTSYTLRDNGTFTLHYAGFVMSDGQYYGPFDLQGRYREAAGVVTFDFDWNNQTAGARGVFSGNAMTVRYTEYMGMSDFQDGVYDKVQ